MDAKKLIAMANQIAAFWGADPDRSVAMAGMQSHLKRFWEPRMRRDLYAHLDAHGPDGLHPLMAEMLQQQRAALLPTA